MALARVFPGVSPREIMEWPPEFCEVMLDDAAAYRKMMEKHDGQAR